MTGNPFTDPATVRRLYSHPGRISQRTDSLLRAKTAGRNAAGVIADLAAAALGENDDGELRVLDVGCGRGSTTIRLAESLAPAHIIGLDQAQALLTDARRRQPDPAIRWACGDFHRLPFSDQTFALAVAAFCLYHSPEPAGAVAEISRCLTPGGVLVAATKSADSYAELDQLLTDIGLDPDAASRHSLYSTFHSGNLTDVLSTRLAVEHVLHEHHSFRFTDPQHLTRYLLTSPKYTLPTDLARSPEALAAALRPAIGDVPIRATSTVSYAVARLR